VTDDQEYEYSVSGTWQTSKEGQPVTADGQDDGAGKLVGVIFNDYKLSEPFELGAYGSFKPPMEGDLFLRCQDKWNEIADNKGKLNVRLKVKGKGNPLPMPKDDATAAAPDATEPSPDSASPPAAKPAKSAKPGSTSKSKSIAKPPASPKSGG
jgi:hypothetical protein